ncbi:phosphatase PAP2 family protein [Mycetocola miduiensis]|uniref:Undecaprenyl-diphosphatase n=1 Tax=Mycetocola miduiensis TaxID=995034 RepID=A0A1I5CL16_9MICO|nr:phosphatase PAP2 family protein [Mycetocola miduiensis]SFN87668.1 undecaprenyl-diphosphatase [Mycetocola miduiensis]
MSTSAQRSSRRRPTPPPAASDHPRRVVLVVFVAAAIAFGIVSGLSYGKRYLAEPVDLWWGDLMLEQRTDAGLFLAWIPAVIGGPIPMLIIGLAMVGTFLYLRWKVVALTVAAAMVTSVAMAAPLAAAVARTRPETSLAETVPTSFPSGHTAMAATVALVLALIFRHWLLWVLGTVWVVAMAWCRTYLEAHWLTDVIAGALLGIIAGSVAWLAIETVRRRRTRTKEEQGMTESLRS